MCVGEYSFRGRLSKVSGLGNFDSWETTEHGRPVSLTLYYSDTYTILKYIKRFIY